MSTVTILEAVRDALAADQPLAAWCQAQFGVDPTIYLGLDEDQPPPQSDYPVIAISGPEQDRGEGKREQTFFLVLGCAVMNKTVTESGRTRTYQGMLQAEQLRELAEEALYRARILSSMESAGSVASDSFYPIFLSFSLVTISQLKTTRRPLPV